MINIYCKSQLELSEEFKLLIDSYWDKKIDEINLIKYLNLLIDKNYNLMYENTEIRPILKQRLGKKRLDLINKILEEEDKLNEKY